MFIIFSKESTGSSRMTYLAASFNDGIQGNIVDMACLVPSAVGTLTISCCDRLDKLFKPWLLTHNSEKKCEIRAQVFVLCIYRKIKNLSAEYLVFTKMCQNYDLKKGQGFQSLFLSLRSNCSKASNSNDNKLPESGMVKWGKRGMREL